MYLGRHREPETRAAPAVPYWAKKAHMVAGISGRPCNWVWCVGEWCTVASTHTADLPIPIDPVSPKTSGFLSGRPGRPAAVTATLLAPTHAITKQARRKLRVLDGLIKRDGLDYGCFLVITVIEAHGGIRIRNPMNNRFQYAVRSTQ